MRSPLLLPLLLLLPACAFDVGRSYTYGDESWGSGAAYGAPDVGDGPATWRSVVDASAPAVAIPDTDGWVVASVSSMTCQLFVDSGMFGTDTDADAGDDHIVDSRPSGGSGDGTTVLVQAGDDLRTVEMPSGAVRDVGRVTGLTDAAFRANGDLVVLRDLSGCGVEWRGDAASSTVALPSSFCGGAHLEMATDIETAFVTDGHHVMAVTPRGATDLGLDADLLAWDPDAQQLYAARSGEGTVTAVAADGTVRWQSDLGPGIRGLDDVATGVVISLASDAGTSELLLLDTDAGEILADQSIGRPAAKLTVAHDGGAMALQGNQLDLFELSL